jgi:hypothetical protein
LSPEGEQELAIYVEEHQDRAYLDLCGSGIPEDVIPDYDPDLSPRRLAEYLDKSRIERLEDGEEPTEEEVELRAAWVYWAANSCGADADIIPGYLGVRLQHSDGRSCYRVLLMVIVSSRRRAQHAGGSTPTTFSK